MQNRELRQFVRLPIIIIAIFFNQRKATIYFAKRTGRTLVDASAIHWDLPNDAYFATIFERK